MVRRWLETLDFGARERWVRMNPIWGEYGEADLEETIGGRPHGYVVPKPRRADDIRRIAAVLERLEHRHGIAAGSTRLVLIATETPEGLLNIREVVAASPRIVAVSWGVEDLAAAMHLPRTRDDGGTSSTSRATRGSCAPSSPPPPAWRPSTPSTPTSPTSTGSARECREAVAMGFTGKISIHPGQIEPINEEFTPSRGAAEEALALIAAFEEHARRGAGAFAWKGQMMDMPHLTRARAIADRARQARVI